MLASRHASLGVCRRGERLLLQGAVRQVLSAEVGEAEVVERDIDGDPVNLAPDRALVLVELRHASMHDEEHVMHQLLDDGRTSDAGLPDRVPGEAVMLAIEILERRQVHTAYFG